MRLLGSIDLGFCVRWSLCCPLQPLMGSACKCDVCVRLGLQFASLLMKQGLDPSPDCGSFCATRSEGSDTGP